MKPLWERFRSLLDSSLKSRTAWRGSGVGRGPNQKPKPYSVNPLLLYLLLLVLLVGLYVNYTVPLRERLENLRGEVERYESLLAQSALPAQKARLEAEVRELRSWYQTLGRFSSPMDAYDYLYGLVGSLGVGAFAISPPSPVPSPSPEHEAYALRASFQAPSASLARFLEEVSFTGFRLRQLDLTPKWSGASGKVVFDVAVDLVFYRRR